MRGIHTANDHKGRKRGRAIVVGRPGGLGMIDEGRPSHLGQVQKLSPMISGKDRSFDGLLRTG